MDNKTKQAMQMALEALEDICDTLGECGMTEKARTTVTAIDEALAQPQGEWVDLTEDDYAYLLKNNRMFDFQVRAVIAKFKEKNSGLLPLIKEKP